MEILLIAKRELRKQLRSLKGMLLLALSGLGGITIVVWTGYVQQRWIQQFGAATLPKVGEVSAQEIYGHDVGTAIASAPLFLLAFLPIAVWAAPFLISMIGFDSVSGELQFRTIRYWATRVHRSSLIIGKTIGLWIAVGCMSLFTHALVWGYISYHGDATLSSTLTWGMRFWLATLPLSLPWCALAVGTSALVRSPTLSFIAIQIVFFCIWIVQFVGKNYEQDWLKYVYPNNYDVFVLSSDVGQLLLGLGACLAYAVIVTGLTCVTFARREL